ISSILLSQISSNDDVSDSFKTSKAVAITNPNKHIAINDSRRITIKLPKVLSDEEILARFVKGFFGGWWFGPERAALKSFGKILVGFEGLKEAPVSKRIWSNAKLSNSHVPPLYSVLFGAFRVVDLMVAHPKDEEDSYIGFAFGSDNWPLAGAHRFCISRRDEVGGENVVTIKFVHSGCDPRENKPLSPAFLQTLHLWYAMVLFREGIAEVMKA
ncbi:hypothetical protein EK21DRAFT_68361, partial [Setomelanomma holmii]